MSGSRGSKKILGVDEKDILNYWNREKKILLGLIQMETLSRELQKMDMIKDQHNL